MTSPTTVPLDGFPPESAADPDVAFDMYGVADDSSFTTHRVSFRLGDLTELAVGSVLVTAIGEEAQQVLSLEEFAHRGESEC
ncbi:hypothetical protein [Micromonospora coriariae]|uniref:hypothetical protein n=1 Tax=Micromonospora coriariae TaxID=285665 RepID=UPI0012FDCB1B|nr:hypothetical protein [Micromonospora coriariae]